MRGAQVHQCGEALRAGHVEVQQQQVRIGLVIDHRVQRLRVLRFADAGAGQQAQGDAAQGFAEQRMVVGDEEGGHGVRQGRSGTG